jgi:hypothetical protein
MFGIWSPPQSPRRGEVLNLTAVRRVLGFRNLEFPIWNLGFDNLGFAVRLLEFGI